MLRVTLLFYTFFVPVPLSDRFTLNPALFPL